MTIRDINDIIAAVCPNDEDYEKPCISPKYLRQKLEQLALEQEQKMLEPTTKNDSKFCPDRKAKTTHAEGFLHCIENDCVAYKDGKCLKYNSDQEPTTKNDLGVDCISRADARHLIAESFRKNLGITFNKFNKMFKTLYEGVDNLPSVTPQEPFINKPCVSSGVCEHDKNVVIDKIRAEIETKYGQCDICEYFEDYDYEENDISEYRPVGNIADILQIFDKYKAESERQKNEDNCY